MIFGDDAFQRRLNHFLRSGRDDVERESMAVDILQELRQKADVLFQTNSLAHLDQVLPSHTPVFGVVQQQVRQLTALLHQADLRKAADSLGKGGNTQQLAQNEPRIVEAESLVEIANEQVFFHSFRYLLCFLQTGQNEYI